MAGADRKVGGGDSGSTSLPVLFFHIQLPFFATRSISQTKREGGNNYIDNSNTHSSKKDVFFSSLPNDLDNYFNSQLYFVSGALASAFCGSS